MKARYLFVVLVFCNLSYAQPSRWSDPVNISNTPGGSGSPEMVVGPDGFIHVVWEDDSRFGNPFMSDIMYVFFDGYHWSNPVQISGFDTTYAWTPRIAVNYNSQPHVVWKHDSIFPSSAIYYATKTDTGWAEPINLTEGLGSTSPAAIAIDSQDNVHVVMAAYNSSGGDWDLFHCQHNGFEWLPMDTIITSNSSGVPEIAIDSNDNLHLAWLADPYPLTEIYYAKYDGISLSPMYNVSQVDTFPSMDQSLALDSDDNPHIVWNQITQWGPDPVIEEIYYNYFDGENWAEAENITNLSLRCDYPKLAISSQDYKFLLYMLFYQNGDFYVNFSYCTDSTWSQPDTLIPDYISASSDIFVDSDDIIHAVISVTEVAVFSDLMYMYNSSASNVDMRCYENIVNFDIDTHPNPFNQSTSIYYSLPNYSVANLNVYNLNGQLIRELKNGISPPGKHQIYWNGRNQFGKEVSAGVYLLRLQVNGQVTTKRLTIIK